ncbi:MAG: 50S ribosomal protein L11 methyltransferase [Acidobacteriota bacterium]
MTEVDSYGLSGYGEMIADTVRMSAYEQALRQAIEPDSVVLDIGTGTGILAFLACQLGARRVYAIEPGDVIQVAREIAAANGFADRIEFIQDLSHRVSLPERADVMVSDLRGVLPPFRRHLPSIIDARARLLAAEGTMIPRCDALWAAVVEAPELYAELTGPWNDGRYGLDMGAARRFVTHAWRKARVKPEQLLTEPQRWATLDYATVKSSDLRGQLQGTARRTGTAHGLVVWFETLLAEGVSFSNAPGEPELLYGSAFFPWPEAITLAAGDTLSVSLQADLLDEDYIWRWDCTVLGSGDPEQVKAEFHQSTFYGLPLTLEQMGKREASHLPVLDTDGQIDQMILSLMDGQTSLAAIAERIAERFPHRFTRKRDALNRVSRLSLKYSR